MGQDYWNAECITKSLDSYKAAYLELLALCPNVRLHGGGCPPVDVLNGSIEPAWGGSANLIEHATSVHVHVASLFDYGRVVDARPGTRTWDSSFFKTTVYIDRTWNIYGVEAGTVRQEEDGTTTRLKDKAITALPRTIRLSVGLRSFGLSQWQSRAGEIRGLLDACKSEAVRKSYAERVDIADREVARWLEAVNRPEVRLPVTV